MDGDIKKDGRGSSFSVAKLVPSPAHSHSHHRPLFTMIDCPAPLWWPHTKQDARVNFGYPLTTANGSFGNRSSSETNAWPRVLVATYETPVPSENTQVLLSILFFFHGPLSLP